jgi:4-hydroxy-4-methyl-2-oxoglutarate aldolase
MSDLYEGLPATVRASGLMSGRMRPLNKGIRATGPAITAQCAPGDNLMLHKALLLAEPGDVLVINGGTPSAAQWGYLAAVYAECKGLAAVVVDGCIRDCGTLIERHYPVWATEISPAHPTKVGPGSVNVPIRCDGVEVRPGDLIAADDDGVLVISPEHLAGAIAHAAHRQTHESEGVAEIQAGRSLFEVHGLDRAFLESGVIEIDGVWDDPRD